MNVCCEIQTIVNAIKSMYQKCTKYQNCENVSEKQKNYKICTKSVKKYSKCRKSVKIPKFCK